MLPFPNIEDIVQVQKPAPPVETPWGWWVAAILLGLLALGLLIGLTLVLYRWASKPAVPPLPEKLARRELKALRKKAGALPAHDFAAALSGIVRSYIQRRMGVLADVSTTPEILGRTAARSTVPPPTPLTHHFRSVLEACDAMKFSSGSAPEREGLLAETDAALTAVAQALSTPPPLPDPAPAAPAHELSA
jgi:hypothetical protein